MNSPIVPKTEILNWLKAHQKIVDPSFKSKLRESDLPLRAELFNAEQMEQHGRILAARHTISSHVPPVDLRGRLTENEEILNEVHHLILQSLNTNHQITPAGEWLLDNFYLIEDHIRMARLHFPKGYNRELPRISHGPSAGLPRVYDIAKEIIAHGDGRIDPESLKRFIKAYQTVTNLKIGELWAIPIMFRFALIENLRRVAYQVAMGRIDRNLADFWAEQMLDILEKDPKSVILVVADMARSEPPISPPFISAFTRRLQGQNTALGLPITWIEQRLSQENKTIPEMIRIGSQQLAADQVSISNSIASLRFLGAMDWKEFVEEMSLIDAVLSSDPLGIYKKMDFQSRDEYRHVIERIARQSKLSEVEIAGEAISLALTAGRTKNPTDRSAHVGYFLIDKGYGLLVKRAHARKSPLQKFHSFLMRNPGWFYLGSLILLTTAIVWLLSLDLIPGDLSWWSKGIVYVTIVLSVSQLAVALINWLTTIIAPPRQTPRVDVSDGIPPESRTLVVVPCMLTSVDQINSLIEHLEVRFLANQDENLLFGLLTDFRDSNSETEPDDNVLIQTVAHEIEELNDKYFKNGPQNFYLFHRPREYNAVEKIWMGYERKRGKLSDLNNLIAGKASGSFSLFIGNRERLSDVKYVITLDEDTELPRDSARQMIGAMIHPLNRPVIDPASRMVKEGYTIMQPRVAVNLPGTNKSRYARLFGIEPGIDPYTRAISDVYQDLFKEGSFIGKGIFDVDAFERVTRDRFPENRILSHDLIEGCYARSVLLSDVLLFEEYPTRYLTDVKRRHRWIRGDWQLFPWLLPRVPVNKSKSQWNPLSYLSWWKIFDNFRRSLIPPALLFLLISGWTFLSNSGLWTLIVSGIVIIPTLIASVTDSVRRPYGIQMKQHLAGSWYLFTRHIAQACFQLITLPYEAWYSLDAILRTLWRMIISRKNLLEWNSPASAARFSYQGITGLYSTMWICPLLSIALLVVLIAYYPASIPVAVIFLLFWGSAPFIVLQLDKPIAEKKPGLTDKQYRFLFELSRRTWGFFEKFVTEEDNWLPPDNFQEHPNPVIAHRTSPTNMGLSLLANQAAYDFGYITSGRLLTRTANSINTMIRMEKSRGHFYNWYDTQSLRPLPPLYVSSVDSGNLAGYLIILRSGLIDIPENPVFGPAIIRGLTDTLNILKGYQGAVRSDMLNEISDAIKAYSLNPPDNIKSAWECMNRLARLSEVINVSDRGNHSNSFIEWARALDNQISDTLYDLSFLAPWMVNPELNDPGFTGIPTLREIANLDPERGGNAVTRIDLISKLIDNLNMLSEMDFGFLYDKSRKLQTIGYNVDDRRMDAGYYDLLASEARLSSYIAISQGQAPQESWFALSRVFTGSNGETILLSWSGSMFEYLMPLVVMPVYENTLIHKACINAIKRQIEFGRQHNIPWGVSESGYHMFDQNLNYQYKAFGVPGLGLKRGLSEDLVIAPYSTALAIMLKPAEACANLERLASEGFMGMYGLYEAVDYTPSRLPRGQSHVVIKSFMSHHQGMSLLSLAAFLCDRPMQKRFESDTLLQASLLLLHERIPRYSAYHDFTDTDSIVKPSIGLQEMPIRVYETPHTPYPETHLLSNGRYHVMITNSGGGYSRWNEMAVSRWREDSTLDNRGTFCYIRDTASGYFWSATYQPTLVKPDRYEVVFSEGKAEFKRRDREIDTYTEVVVSPEDDMELRRVNLKNRTRTRRVVDVISYFELVLATPAAEKTHPAFNNLFVQTEIVYQRQAILGTRRPRSSNEKVPWMYHLMAAHGTEIVNISYETDRLKFLGRGNTPENPVALTKAKSLGNSEGSVLDPIAAIHYQVVLEPEGSAILDIVTGMTDDRETAMAMIEKYQDRQLANRVFELAWTHSQVMLQQINAVEADARLYGRLASSIIYPNRSFRPESSVIMRNRKGQSGLWGHSISGDIPIILVQIEDPENINFVRQLIQAHAYWRLKGLYVDMVIWIEDFAGYRQVLHDQIMAIIAGGIEAGIIGKSGGIFLRTADQLSAEDRILFQAVARVSVSDKNGTLPDQLNRRITFDPVIAPFRALREFTPQSGNIQAFEGRNLEFYNGKGGFTPDGREYIIFTSDQNMTPMPWSNVLANPYCGTVISENGQAYTWCENAHEFRLSPWNNDPVTDISGEVIYIRDEETGYFWSPTPFIKNDSSIYKSRHGFGYSIFERSETGIDTELCIYVPLDAPVKYSVLKIRNNSQRPRKLSVTGYVEWVLGELRSKTAMHVTTDVDVNTGTILARNSFNFEFSERVAFFQASANFTCSFTCDRTEFLGRNGSLKRPAAMNRAKLSGKRGAALDPCAAIQVIIEIEQGGEQEIVFILGAGKNGDEALDYSRRMASRTVARAELERVWEFWKTSLDTIHVQTPDKALNYLVNGWLMYQTLVSRIWARSGYYQSGGAYGYRDQLQDAMAVVHSNPALLRNQILLHAGRQFIEGDVQHWWHPPTGRGVRTLCSDDFLWLPLATCRYINVTGDMGILDEMVPFLEGRPLNHDEESYYDLPGVSGEKTTVFEHCKRAVENGLRFGEHGLPLMGSHDWNDGMSRVGHQGKGESVWLGYFMYDVLQQFSLISDRWGNRKFADKCRTEAEKIRANIDFHAWDGNWYLRAFFDDGTPLGSQVNPEGKIDSISQSWSVISDAGRPDRKLIAMESVNSKLVRRDIGIVQLLDPAFDKSELDPGYIKGYVPGVRENGGQYTHAAIWTVMAFARLRDKKNAWEVLSLINPVNHALNESDVEIYKVEPYVIAADVYSMPPHTGRGGWTWYTGSAGWMYRLITESMLGLTLEENRLFINPLMPDEWESFQIDYRYQQTIYKIEVVCSGENTETIFYLDGNPLTANYIQLVNDGREHFVNVII